MQKSNFKETYKFMKEIAFYGKGGIGKSTVCANLSAALAILDRKVLQIGCDPKHDSTRLLTHGADVTTALDYMRHTKQPDYQIDAILHQGYCGVGCVEAGGPEPGVGCAGRGIISTFELINRFKLKDNYDNIVYDVLGDVVCGGFAVPIRREYANAIFIVTSGEFMSLYAANNILRGIQNYDKDEHRVAGIIFNKRNIPNEDERVNRFAKAVKLPICAEIPRDEVFAESERLKMTVIEHNAKHDVSKIFTSLAQTIIDGCKLYEAKPLDNDILENVILDGSSTLVTAKVIQMTKAKSEISLDLPSQHEEAQYFSKQMMKGEPLHGCAFNGAMALCTQINGVVNLAHSPKSCMYIIYQAITHTGMRTMRVQGTLQSVNISPDIECTEMNDSEVVFGGMDKLGNKINEIKSRLPWMHGRAVRGQSEALTSNDQPQGIIIISSCPSGIIGDDVESVQTLEEPNMPIITIKADGNINGDYVQGMLESYVTVARRLINKNVDIIPKTVNIIAEKIILTDTMNDNFKVINSFLQRMGVKVNCRFIYDTNINDIKNLCSAELNLLAYGDYTGTTIERFLTNEYDCKFLDMPFPVGINDTKTWLNKVANHFACPQIANTIISENQSHYDSEIAKLKKILAGKKLMIITYNHELDWIIQTALDVGIEIVKIGLLNYYQDEGFRTNIDVELPIELDYNSDNRADDIAMYQPDILLANYQFSLAGGLLVADTIPLSPYVGFFSGLSLAKRWANLLQLNQKGEWQQDEQLFNKYLAR